MRWARPPWEKFSLSCSYLRACELFHHQFLKPRKARHFPKAGAVPSVFSFARIACLPSESTKHVDALRESVMFAHHRLGQMMRPLTIRSWRNARGRGTGEVCARRLFFSALHLEEHRGCTRSVYSRLRLRYLALKKVGFFERQSTVFSLSSQELFQTSDAPTWVSRIQIQTQRIAQNRHRDTGHGVYCGRWRCLGTFKKLGFLAVQLWPTFLLKYSLRRAMLQLEFRWSKPDKSHSEQSKTETRKTDLLVENTEIICTDRPAPRPDAPSLTQTIIVQMVYYLPFSRPFQITWGSLQQLTLYTDSRNIFLVCFYFLALVFSLLVFLMILFWHCINITAKTQLWQSLATLEIAGSPRRT